MRVIECNECGETLQAARDDELTRASSPTCRRSTTWSERGLAELVEAGPTRRWTPDRSWAEPAEVLVRVVLRKHWPNTETKSFPAEARPM